MGDRTCIPSFSIVAGAELELLVFAMTASEFSIVGLGQSGASQTIQLHDIENRHVLQGGQSEWKN
jgi:hypothetical protein